MELSVTYCSTPFLEGLRKTTKYFRNGEWNSGPPERETGTPTSTPHCLLSRGYRDKPGILML